MSRFDFTVLSVFTLLVILPATARAESPPTFYLDSCCWHATHIVRANEGDTVDGVLTVTQSYLGNLKVGAELKIPKLAIFEDVQKRTVRRWDLDILAGEKPKQPPFVVQGKDVILFLKRGDDKTRDIWVGADPFTDEISLSAIWIEGKSAYAMLSGPTSFAPAALQEWGTLAKAEKAIAGALTLRHQMEALANDPDPNERLRMALSLTRGNAWSATEAAWDIVVGCGEKALPTLRQMLCDPSEADRRKEIVKILVKTGGRAVVPDLLVILRGELDWWKKESVNLSEGWWDDRDLPRDKVRNRQDHYGVLLETLVGLSQIEDRACAKDVRALMAFWQSQPLLDRGGTSQIHQVCRSLLRKLEDKQPRKE